MGGSDNSQAEAGVFAEYLPLTANRAVLKRMLLFEQVGRNRRF